MKGDTIQGLIDDRDWSKNPKLIKFHLNGEINEYSPIQILAFGTDKESYKSFITRIDFSPYKVNEMIENDPIKYSIDTVFARLIIKSKSDLYYVKDLNAKEHFFINTQSEIEELELQKGLINKNGRSGLIVNEYYKVQLKNFMADQPKIASTIEQTNYNIPSMLILFNKYNQIYGGERKELSNKDKTKVELEAIVGISMNYASFQGIHYEDAFAAAKQKKSIKPLIGAALIVYLPRNRKQWSIDNQINYTSYNAIKSGRYKLDNYHDFSDFNFGASYMKLVNILKYQYPKGMLRSYIGIGISNGIALAIKNGYYSHNNIDPQNSDEQKVLNEIRKYEQGLVFNAGVSFNKWKIELRHDRTNGMSPYPDVNNTIKGTQLLLHYRLK
ncbi:hypothetical protein [Solitalea koreensis]|uniref:Outer membrane protein beta-barrel domain-containing protein n=1 Tax=Solitalea koreensis TaxID=543615 RepID=A0A521BCW2_9SPHI|nr:hypothetical protein [Solitalea koreensis]SMO44821.1 hypothetical protein SAMN06265350_10292 [Solitalea koreensis]